MFAHGHPPRLRRRRQPRADLLHVPDRHGAGSKQLKGKADAGRGDLQREHRVPMLLGIAVALPLYKLLGPDNKFVAFALFMGVSMSITAFPVLARILSERRMLKRPLGSLTIGCAAIDDVGVVSDRARHHDRRLGLVRAVVCDGRSRRSLRARDGVRGAAGPGAAGDRVRRGRAASPAGGWRRSSSACWCRRTSPKRSTSTVIFGGFIMGMVMPRNAQA